MSLRRWVLVLVFLPLLLVAGQTLGFLFLGHATRNLEQEANQASDIYVSVAQIATGLQQADIAARSYVFTGNEQDRVSYGESRQALRYQFGQLVAAANGEPLLGSQVPELQYLAQTILEPLNAAVYAAQIHRRNQARMLVATHRVDDVMEEFSIAQKRFADVAYHLRTERLARLNTLWELTTWVVVAAALCGLALTVGLSFVAQRYLARRIERVAQRAAAYTVGRDAVDSPVVEGTDEIARLDRALSTMADRVSKRETELRFALAEAEAASMAKSTFVATVSHEIRTPLNGVIGMSDLLMESSLSERDREYVKTIRTSSALLLGIVNDILDFSKLSSGELSIENNEIALEPLVGSVVSMFAAEANAKALEMRTSFAREAPLTVLGDELRLRQILVNLIGNAVKFTPAGSVTIAISADSQRPDILPVTFRVSDTGIGIPETMREVIFEPFQQGDMSKTRRFGGTGLGLTIARRLVALMNGTITVESAEGGGSVFSFTLPIGRPVVAAKTHADLPAANTANEIPPKPTEVPRTEHVLVVEDNEINQRVAIRLLQRLGFQPQVAVDGREALNALQEDRYDLILMDLQMPVLDGFETSLELRRREANQGGHIPIVAMTANALPEDREACFAAGMDDHVAKPVTLAELRRVVGRWLPDPLALTAKKANNEGHQ